MISKDSVSVDRLAGGDLVPRLNDALQKLAENVLDPSTKATAPRKITLTITMKPDDNRDMGSVELGIAVKLAAPKPASSPPPFTITKRPFTLWVNGVDADDAGGVLWAEHRRTR